MINLISRLWNNFKNQPDIWFFFGFLLTFTLSIRKVLLHFPIQGTFNEYCATYIYLSDILLILTFIFWFILILSNISLSLSSSLPPTKNRCLQVKSILNRILVGGELWISSATHKLYILLPLFLVFLSFISTLWSQNLSIAVFRSFKFLEFYLLYIYIIFRIVPRGTIDTPFFSIRRIVGDEVDGSQISWLFFNIIILSGLFQAIVGIIQFFLQKSIGLFWLRESLISPDILGVAKIILNGEKYIRAYGFMPHPNILGGFLLFSIVITFLYKKLFHVEQNTPHPNLLLIKEKELTPLSFIRRGAGDEVYYRWTFRLILAIQILALILTFSKSALIGLLIAFVYINVPRGTKYTSPNPSPYKGEGGSDCSMWNNSQIHLTQTLSLLRRGWLKMFHVEQSKNTPHPNLLLIKEKELDVPRGTFRHPKLIILSGLIILLSVFFIIKPNLNYFLFNSLNERLFYLNVPRGTFESDPVFGLGAGQSVLSMQKYFPQKLEFWQYQPVHNVFLLVFSELGLIGLGLFIWWLWKLLQNTPHPSPLLIKEREQIVPRGTISNTPFSLIRRRDGDEVAGSQSEVNNNDHILHNDNTYLSSVIVSRYFKGILLGFIFIMLFDHYIWDIQQGSLLFWLTAGFVAGIKNMYKQKFS